MAMQHKTLCATLGLALALLGGPAAVQARSAATEALLTQGDQQWKARQLEEAQKAFQLALKAEPGAVDIELKLAGLQLTNNDFAACIPSYQHIIGLDANNVRAWLGLGFAYLHTGKNSLSMAAFQEAIRLDPSKKAALQPMLAKLQTPLN
jgi:tetratricopeptide (TPR) repeat protein